MVGIAHHPHRYCSSSFLLTPPTIPTEKDLFPLTSILKTKHDTHRFSSLPPLSL